MRFIICVTICAIGLTLSLPAQAVSSDLTNKLLSCHQIRDEMQRLTCYDQLVNQVKGTDDNLTAAVQVKTTTGPTKPMVTPNPPEVVTPDLTEKFGKIEREASSEIQEIRSQVEKVDYDRWKKRRITLANGQQWQQLDQDYLNVKPGSNCMVERGVFGSFLFSIDGVSKKIRVKRVR